MNPNWMIPAPPARRRDHALQFAAKRALTYRDAGQRQHGLRLQDLLRDDAQHRIRDTDLRLHDRRRPLFQRADNIEAGWQAVQPILDHWSSNPPKDFPNMRRVATARGGGRTADAQRAGVAPARVKVSRRTIGGPRREAGDFVGRRATPMRFGRCARSFLSMAAAILPRSRCSLASPSEDDKLSDRATGEKPHADRTVHGSR